MKGKLIHVPFVVACKTSRKNGDKNYFNEVCLYRILCIKFFGSQPLVRDHKNIVFLLVQRRTFLHRNFISCFFFFFK